MSLARLSQLGCWLPNRGHPLLPSCEEQAGDSQRVLPRPWWVSVCPLVLLQEDSDAPISESLSIENALWAGTVTASGTVLLRRNVLTIYLKRKENPFV